MGTEPKSESVLYRETPFSAEGEQTKGKVLAIAVVMLLLLMIPITPSEYAEEAETKDLRAGTRGNTLYVGAGQTYEKIQDAIDAAEEGDTIRVYAGKYYENILVSKSLSVIGDGSKDTIIKGKGNGEIVKINADWVNISGFAVEKIDSGEFNGILLDNVQYCRIEKMNASREDTWIDGNGILLQSSNYNTIADTNASMNNDGGIFLRESNYNKIINNTCCLNGVDGIWLENSNYNVISNNILNMNEDDGLYLDHSVKNVVVGNQIQSNDRYAILLENSNDNNISDTVASSNGAGFFIYHSHGVKIMNNSVLNNGNDGITLWYSNYTLVTNNNATSNFYGIYLFFSSINSFFNNTMWNNSIFIHGDWLNNWNTHNIDTSNRVNDKPIYYWKNRTNGIIPQDAGEVILANCTGVRVENQIIRKGSFGIELGFSNDNDILNNYLDSNTMDGIHLYRSMENTLANNLISNNFDGITIKSDKRYVQSTNTSNNTIVNNTIANNGVGIYIDQSSNNQISNNNIFSNENGFVIIYSENNRIMNNNVSTNRDSGIHIRDSTNNKIIRNIFSNNYCGVDIKAKCSSNSIYHNNFINNTKQATDSGTLISWDNGAQGNYWSEWTTPDANNDGIVDMPYSLPGVADSKDNHPLTQPVVFSEWEFIDADYDLIPDSWENKYFNNLTYGPNDDPDGDGLTNHEEYTKNSDPSDPNSPGGDSSDLGLVGLYWYIPVMIAIVLIITVILIAVLIRNRHKRPKKSLPPIRNPK